MEEYSALRPLIEAAYSALDSITCHDTPTPIWPDIASEIQKEIDQLVLEKLVRELERQSLICDLDRIHESVDYDS